ncbi:MAG: insulinase family protein, partial [Bacteroidia bacterium]|nr:insulinase family protein [Bacteroidia bacterium]
MDLLIHTLPNGIRLVHAPVSGMVAHCGLIINAGSRDELQGEHGIAHFIEHMLFKGTKKRKSYHILSRLEDVGGELNAYTTKEDTAIYASFLRDDFERATELIADITFNSIYPEKEIKKEKDVVIEEINSYLDTPAELIFDEFEEQIFDGLPLGRSILGKPDTVRSFSRKKVTEFITRNYCPEQIVFCSVGNIPVDRILKSFKHHFENIKSGKKENQKSLIWNYKSSNITRQ